MDVNVLRHSQLVKEVSGDVIAVSPGGSARKVLAGETIDSDNIVITINGASVIMNNAESQLSVIDENCVACVDETSTWNVAPIAGDVSVDLDKLSGAEFGEDDLAAIQDAILAGEDPTELLEATAAGGAAGSANAGFVTIDYTGAEVLASTFFETSALATEEQDDDDDELDTTALAVGGDAFSESLQEGSLSLGNYPQTITSSITIFSGDLPLDPESFVPESSSLAALLSELNTDITSSGQVVTFSYDSTENAIVGIRNADAAEVLSIDLNASQSGNDVSLTMVTTISQPIDHIVSIGGGLVSLADDQITITFDIEGADSGGNSMLAPIEAQVAVIDGADPAPTTVNIENTETDTQVLAGEFVQIGSDSLSTVAFQPSALAQFDGLFSDNQATQATLSNDAKTITLSLVESDDPVLVITIDTDGRYQFQQFKSLEHNESDELILSLPTTVTDFDLDTATNAITITIIDGQNPVINNVTAIEVDESGISGGSNEGISAVSGTGDITANAGSDAIDHFELEPSEFNTDGSLTSQGQAIQLELASSDNGVRSYQGYIVLDGTRVTVFEAQIDTPELGKYQFTLFEQLDHLGNQDSSLTINLPIYAVDTDGDRSSVTEGSLTNEAAWIQINVADDALELVDNTFSVTEPTEDGDTTFSHSLFTDTPSSEGADTATIQSFTYSGNTYNLVQSAEDNASQTFTLTEGTLTISLNGDFSFDVARDIDHSTNETINKQFVFTARDGDGDIDTATVDLAITDGQIPDIKVVPKVDLSEASLLDGTSPNSALVSSSASIVYAQGSDDVSHF
ncbi:retention module-containing protein, partial [Vibrio genomosp. F10]|uniref:retention module-containing protein n=1 Tax=Vibrio genomosp. F10 TaxID=723171 RepID=UPI00037A031D